MLLPTSRSFVTALLDSFSATAQHVKPQPIHHHAEASNPLHRLTHQAKKQLLSLHVLFPHEFVPALDLLDRRLVTRFLIVHDEESNATSADANPAPTGHDKRVQTHDPTAPTETRRPESAHNPTVSTASPPVTPSPSYPTVYYVRSAQARSTRFTRSTHSFDTTTAYQVRLRAWNCSCPAFAFAAFSAVHPERPALRYNPPGTSSEPSAGPEEDAEWTFGGVSLDQGMPPVCKHILACVLAEKCSSVFGECIVERSVGVDEAAGWAAGWGD